MNLRLTIILNLTSITLYHSKEWNKNVFRKNNSVKKSITLGRCGARCGAARPLTYHTTTLRYNSNLGALLAMFTTRGAAPPAAAPHSALLSSVFSGICLRAAGGAARGKGGGELTSSRSSWATWPCLWRCSTFSPSCLSARPPRRPRPVITYKVHKWIKQFCFYATF